MNKNNTHSVQKITGEEMFSYLSSYLPLLQEIPKPPKELFIRGEIPLQATTAHDAEEGKGYIYMTVVGSRKYSQYGKEACELLISGLRGLPIVIVSGLALGIDSIAHRSAIKAGLKTIAIPGSGIDDATVYPASHLNLAREILDHGGAILSPFPEGMRAQPWTFPVRNNLMAGISHATCVIEADIKSGTLITSKYATDFNRDVFALPGSIFSSNSAGPHMLIRSGAIPISNSKELCEALGFFDEDTKETNNTEKDIPTNISETEKRILEALIESKTSDILAKELNIAVHEIQTALSSLEIKQYVREIDGFYVKK